MGTVPATPSAHRPFLGQVLLLHTVSKTCPGIILTQVCPLPSLGDEGGAADGTESQQLCLSCGPGALLGHCGLLVLVSACLRGSAPPSAGTADGLPGAAPDGEPQVCCLRWVPDPVPGVGAALGGRSPMGNMGPSPGA